MERPFAPEPDVREELRRLPGCFQLPLTWITGKAHLGQDGPRIGPAHHLAGSVCSLFFGIIFSLTALARGGWWSLLILLGWAVTLHGMRNLRMLIFHQCAHRNMWRRAGADRVLGRGIAALLLVQGLDQYAAEHVVDHHARQHMTLRDPTVQAFLRTLRFSPAMSRQQMWHSLLRKLVSPSFHIRFFLARLRSFWTGSDQATRRGAVGAYLAVAVALSVTGTWAEFAVAWLVPVTVLFQISNTLRLCVKHTFPDAAGPELQGRARMAGYTNAIFVAERPPSRELAPVWRAVGWLRWGVRMVAIHVPTRYLVLTGDTVCHDYHHRYPRSLQWPNYPFARQRDLESGDPAWPPYVEVWGLVPAINYVFDSITRADPRVYNAVQIGAVSDRTLFAAFDD